MFLKIFYLIFLLSSQNAFSAKRGKDISSERCRGAVVSLSEHRQKLEKQDLKRELLSALSLSIENLNLSTRARNALKKNNIRYIWELAQKSERQLLRLLKYRKKELNEIKEELSRLGLKLNMKFNWPPTSEELEVLAKTYKKDFISSLVVSIESHPILLLPIEVLNFSIRSYNTLKSLHIRHVGDLVQISEGELLKTQNFGRKSLTEIKTFLSERGLQMGMILNRWPPTPEQLKSSGILNEKTYYEILVYPLLTPTEEEILRLRFGIGENEPHTYKEMKQLLDLSEKKIKDVQAKALQKLYYFAHQLLGMDSLSLLSQPKQMVEELLKKLNAKEEQTPSFSPSSAEAE